MRLEESNATLIPLIATMGSHVIMGTWYGPGIARASNFSRIAGKWDFYIKFSDL